MNYLYIALIVFGITAVIGVSLGLYLTKYCDCTEEEEQYECDAHYTDTTKDV